MNALLAPLRTRIANMVSRAVVKLVNDSKKMQLMQLDILDGESRDEIERFQDYGFTSVPLEGAEAVVIFPGGRRDHGLTIVVDDRRYRLRNLESGEVAMYTDQGDSIVIKRGGNIEVTAAGSVLITSPTVELSASTKVIAASPLVELAGNSNPVAKGDTLNTAIATLASAIGTAVASIPAAAPSGGVAAGAAITTAVTTFTASATAALSLKVKVG